MSDHRDKIEELVDQACFLENGAAKVALLEEAVRLADAHNDAASGFHARMQLVSAAMSAGQPDVMLVAFSWCLSQCDRDPQQFDEEGLLWEYKWIVEEVPIFPQVSRAQIDDMLRDMEKRYTKVGSSLHAVHQLRRDVSMYMGDRAAALAAAEVLDRTHRDRLSNCEACVLDGTVEYLLFLDKPSQALEKAGPILKGRQSCAEVPHRTFARVLLPLLQEWEVQQALAYHRQGYKMIARNPKFLSQHGMHLTFLTLTDNLARGVRLLERHLPMALATTGLAWRFDFYLAAQLLLERLAEKGKEVLKLRLPQTFALWNEKERYQVENLACWLTQQLRDLAGRFDARNGNAYFTQRIAELQHLKKLVTPCPLPKTRPEGEVPPELE
jgi:hypothetical protein